MRALKRPQRTLFGKWEPAEGLPPKVPKEIPKPHRCDRCGGHFTEHTVIDLALALVFRSLCPACLLVIEAKIARRK